MGSNGGTRLAGAVAVMAVSSALGLRGVLAIWLVSVPADAVFVVGSVAVVLGQVALARQRGVLGAALAAFGGFLAHWMIYALSFSLVVGAEGEWIEDSGDVVWVVFVVGWIGLAFASLAPATWGFLLGRREARKIPPPTRPASWRSP